MSLSRLTRGKTRPGRLRLLDPFLVEQLATNRTVRILDVGIGAEPDTTLELHRAALRAGCTPHTLGTDVDRARVDRLAAVGEPRLSAACVDETWQPALGFDLVRAANILRQYKLDRVGPALDRWSSWVRPGGRLVEGTTDKAGDRGVFRVFERAPDGLIPIGLLAFIDLTSPGFAPRALTPYLPRGLGWHGHPSKELEPLFAAWRTAFEHARSVGSTTVPDLFTESAAGLARRGMAHFEPASWRAGRILLTPPGARLGLAAEGERPHGARPPVTPET